MSTSCLHFLFLLMPLITLAGIPKNNQSSLNSIYSSFFCKTAQDKKQFSDKTADSYKSLIEEGWSFIKTQENQKAIIAANKALAQLNPNSLDHQLWLGEAHALLAQTNFNQGKLSESLRNSLLAHSYLSKLPTSKRIRELLAKSLNDMGYIYSATSDYEKSKKRIKSSLAISKDSNDWALVADSYLTLAGAQIRIGMDQQAEKNLRKGKDAAEKAMDTLKVANILVNMGSLDIRKGKHNRAIGNFKKSLQLLNGTNELAGTADVLMYMAKAYRMKKNIPFAHTYIDSSLSILSTIEAKYIETRAILQKAIIYKEEGKYEKSIEYLKNNLLLAKKIQSSDMMIQIHETLYQTYKEMGKLQESLMYFEIFAKAKDSAISAERDRKLEILEVEYNYDLVTSELEKNKAALRASEEKRKRVYAITIFAIALIILVCVFAFITVLKQKKFNQLKQIMMEREMSARKKQIQDLAIHINEKNEMLQTIKDTLKNVKIQHTGSKTQLLDTIHFINTNVNQKKEKIQLFTDSENGKDDFLYKLNTLHPSLTEKEKGLATLIRLGYSSKDIALKQNIEVVSVNNYRSSLRKKLGIEKGMSLKSYIGKI